MLSKETRTSLYKYKKNLDPRHFEDILREISDPNVTEIDLAELNLYGDSLFIQLLQVIKNKNNLNKLTFPIFGADLNIDPEIFSLVNELIAKFKLAELNFKYWRFCYDNWKFIQGIENSHITSLTLPNMYVEGAVLCDAIKLSLSSFHLREVDLSGLRIIHDSEFLEVLKNNSNLQKFTVPGLDSIAYKNAAFLSSLPQAKYIDFSTIYFSYLSPEAAKSLLDGICENRRVEAVQIDCANYPSTPNLTSLGEFLKTSNSKSLKRVFLGRYSCMFSSDKEKANFYKKYITPSNLNIYYQECSNGPWIPLSSSTVYAEGAVGFFAFKAWSGSSLTPLDLLPHDLLTELLKYDRLEEPTISKYDENQKTPIISKFISDLRVILLNESWRDFGGLLGGSYLSLDKVKNVSALSDKLKDRLLPTPVYEALNLINKTNNCFDVNNLLLKLEKIFDDAVHNPDWIHRLKRNLFQSKATINKFEDILAKIMAFRIGLEAEQVPSPIPKS